MATGIVETSNGGLFENEIELNGKYATMVRFLKEQVGLFNTYREAYVIATIVGYLECRGETKDTSDKVQPASIFAADLKPRMLDLKFMYRTLMLVEDIPGGTIEDYMNRAFRYDSDSAYRDKLRENMKKFHSYTCGGLEFLYGKFKDLNRLDDVVNTLYDYIHEFANSVGILDDEDELPDFTPTFD